MHCCCSAAILFFFFFFFFFFLGKSSFRVFFLVCLKDPFGLLFGFLGLGFQLPSFCECFLSCSPWRTYSDLDCCGFFFFFFCRGGESVVFKVLLWWMNDGWLAFFLSSFLFWVSVLLRTETKWFIQEFSWGTFFSSLDLQLHRLFCSHPTPPSSLSLATYKILLVFFQILAPHFLRTFFKPSHHEFSEGLIWISLTHLLFMFFFLPAWESFYSHFLPQNSGSQYHTSSKQWVHSFLL